MSAANAPLPTSSLDAERRAHEPSMEEILASIRKIIADDDSAAASSAPAPAERSFDWRAPRPAPPRPFPTIGGARPAEPAAPEFAEPLGEARPTPTLEAPIVPAETRPSAFEHEAPVDIQPVRFDAFVAERAPAAQETEYDLDQDEADFDEIEMSESNDDFDTVTAEYGGAVESEVAEEPINAALVSADAAAAVAAQFQTLAATMVINDSGLLHRYAQEMLRPMLKQWLDDNLPVIVEKLVRAEIERVARGGRR